MSLFICIFRILLKRVRARWSRKQSWMSVSRRVSIELSEVRNVCRVMVGAWDANRNLYLSCADPKVVSVGEYGRLLHFLEGWFVRLQY